DRQWRSGSRCPAVNHYGWSTQRDLCARATCNAAQQVAAGLVAPAGASATKSEALLIQHYFRRRLARFKLSAHFLDLNCLLFELSCESRYLFLQLLNLRIELRVGLGALWSGCVKITLVSGGGSELGANPSIGVNSHESRGGGMDWSIPDVVDKS